MQKEPGVKWWSRYILTATFLVFNTANVNAASGSDWLETQIQPDGSYAGLADIATPYQATVETISAYYALETTAQPGILNALQFINTESYHTTEVLSRKIIANSLAGNDVTTLVTELFAVQNIDGGYGDLLGYQSNALDTAFALKALSGAGVKTGVVVGNALSFLQSQQHTDGSFGVSYDETASTYATALAIEAMMPFVFSYNVILPLQSAMAFLDQSQVSGGGWETNWETAISLIALVPLTNDVSVYNTVADQLRQAQLTNGSWEDDVYITALVLHAIRLMDKRNQPIVASGDIVGSVIDGATNQPLAGVTVDLSNGSAAQTTLNGGFSFSQVNPQSYGVTVNHPGYMSASTSATVMDGQVFDLGQIILMPKAGVGVLSGLVTDHDTGLAISGATIDLAGAIAYNTNTGAAGTYSLELVAGDYTVSMSAAGYETAMVSINIVDGQSLTVSPALYPTGSGPVDSNVSVTGTVVDTNTNQTLNGVLVSDSISGASAFTNASGAFSLSGLVAGNVNLSITLSGYAPASINAVTLPGQQLNLGLIGLTPEVAAPTVSSLSGHVLDRESGDPIAGATVSIPDLNLVTKSDASGFYHITDITTLTFVVKTEAIGFVGSQKQISTSAYRNLSLNISMQRAIASGLDIRSVATNAPTYEAHQQVNLISTLANLGDADKSVSLSLQIFNADNTMVDQLSSDTPLLIGAAAAIEHQFVWFTSTHLPGTYQLVVQAYDTDTQALLAERGTVIEILSTTSVGGTVDLSPPVTILASEKPIALSATITNSGNQVYAASSAVLTVTLKNEGFTAPQPEFSLEQHASSFSDSRQMVRDELGNFYVGNCLGQSIDKVLPDGSITPFVSSTGCVTAIDRGSDGILYAATDSAKFLVIQPDASYQKFNLTYGTRPVALKVLGDGRVLLLENSNLWSLDPSSNYAATKVLGPGLDKPMGVATDSQGSVFVASSADQSIAKISNGDISTFATGIPAAAGVAVDANDNLLVVSNSLGTLYKISPAGVKSTIATGLDSPYDVIISPEDNYIVSSFLAGKVLSITPAGVVSTLVNNPLKSPVASDYDDAGNLYMINNNGKIIKRSVGGTTTTIGTNGFSLSNITLLDSNNMYGLGYNTVYHFDLQGNRSTFASNLQSPSAITSNPISQKLLIAEYQNKTISEWDTSGAKTTYMQPYFNRAKDMISTPDGSRYILSYDNYVTHIAPDGLMNFIVSGQTGMNSMAVSEQGVVYIALTTGNQIIKIDQGVRSVVANLPFGPNGLGINAAGELFVGKTYTGEIYKLDTNGTLSLHKALPNTTGQKMVVDAQGTVWVLSQNRWGIFKILSDGTYNQYSVGRASGIVADDIGGLYVSGKSFLTHISAAGTTNNLLINGFMAGQDNVGVTLRQGGGYHLVTALGLMYEINPDLSLNETYASVSNIIAMDSNGNSLYAATPSYVVEIDGAHQLPRLLYSGAVSKLAITSNNKVIMALGYNVLEYDINTRQVSQVAGNYKSISGLSAKPSGGFAVLDKLKHSLELFDQNSSLVYHTVGLDQPRGLLFDQSGRLLVANGGMNQVSTVLDESTLVPLHEGVVARFMHLEPSGNILLSHEAGLQQISATGTLLAEFAETGLTGLIRTQDNRLLAARQYADAIYDYQLDGTGTVYATGLKGAVDLELDAQNAIYLGKGATGTITRLNADDSLAVVATGLPGLKSFKLMDDGSLHALFGQTQLATIDALQQRLDYNASHLSLIGKDLWSVQPDQIMILNSNSIFRFNILPTSQQSSVGQVAFTTSIPTPSLPINSSPVVLDFGSWVPTASGEYLVEVGMAGESNSMTNVLHVGPNADANISVAAETLPVGSSSTTGLLRIVGADTTSITELDSTQGSLKVNGLGRAMAADSKGNIFAISITGRIKRIAPDGTMTDYSNVIVRDSLAVGDSDYLYAIALDRHNIYQFSPQGEISTLTSINTPVTSLAVDYQNRLYATAEPNKLYRIHDDGSTELLTTAGLIDPYGLTIDPYGNFYVLNSGSTIVKITPDLKSTLHFDKAVFEYEGFTLTADCGGNLLFAPLEILPYKQYGEETHIFQLMADTGEVKQMLYGLSVDNTMSDMDALVYDRFGQRLLVWSDIGASLWSFPVKCGSIDVDAHVVARADVDFSSANPMPDTVVDLGDNTKEYIWNLTNVDVKGENIDLSLLVNNLTEGETRPVFSKAFLSYNNSFAPGEIVTTPIDIPNVTGLTDVAVLVNTDKAQYGPNADVLVDTGMTNNMATDFNGNLRLNILDQAGSVVEQLALLPLTPLLAGDYLNQNNSWNTGTVLAGEYRVVAQLERDSGEIVATAESAFTILSFAPDATTSVYEASIYADKQTYQAWDSVSLAARIQNVSENTITDASIITVSLKGPDGTVLYTDTANANGLVSQAIYDANFYYTLVDAVVGVYTIEMSVTDAATGTLLAQSNNTFSVDRINLQALTGSVTADVKQIYAGDAVICTDTVTNNSAADINGAVITYSVLNADTRTTISFSTDNLNLTGGQSTSSTRTIDTAGFEDGGYVCMLQATLEGQTQTLGFAGFQILMNANSPPVANAGINQEGYIGDTIILNGSASTDPDGDELTYLWSITAAPAGSTAILNGATTAQPSFVIDQHGSYTLQLIVNDGEFDSEPSAVTVTVLNRIPVANAGPDQGQDDAIETGATIYLDGSGSSDEDNDPLTYQWQLTQQPAGSTANIVNPTSATPFFVSDVEGDFIAQLIVNDGLDNSLADTVLIHVVRPRPLMDVNINLGSRGRLLVLLDNSAPASSNDPALIIQRDFLEMTLQQAQWSYTIVEDTTQFATELRTGGYMNYAILSAFQKLDNQVQKELREAIYRGEGLLVAGGHDNRNALLDEALGIKHIGVFPDVTGVDVAASELSEITTGTDLAIYNKVLRTELASATAIATWQFDPSANLTNANADNTALTTYQYGNGMTVYAGFDLLAQATSSGESSLFSQLLTTALDVTHPTEIQIQAGSVVPVQVMLTNLKIATGGIMAFTLPTGAEVVDSTDATLNADGTLSWDFYLPEDGTELLTFYVRVPASAGSFTITADIITDEPYPGWDYGQFTFDIAVTAQPTLSDVVALAQNLFSQTGDNAYKLAAKNLTQANDALAINDLVTAVKKLLAATDNLMDVVDAEAGLLRLQVDQILRNVARGL